jgi:hypothetical protein
MKKNFLTQLRQLPKTGFAEGHIVTNPADINNQTIR